VLVVCLYAGDAENDASENLMILDHKDVPISVYDSVRKVMVRKAGTVCEGSGQAHQQKSAKARI